MAESIFVSARSWRSEGDDMSIRKLLLCATVVGLAGCSSVDLNEPPVEPSLCNAESASHVTGRKISSALQEEAKRSSGADMIRVIRPGQMVTKDYRAERLNLQLNDFDVVVRAYCG